MNGIIKIEDVRCFINENDIVYLNLEDVAIGLGFIQFKNGKQYIRWERINGYLKEFNFIPTSGEKGFIPENIFYRLCMMAQSDIARKFQALVCDVILPQIRKTGGYIPITDNDDENEIMAKALMIAQKTLAKKDQIIAQQKPKVEYYDRVLDTENTLTITQIAKSFGMSGVRLNKILHDSCIQYKQSGQWMLYSKYADMGLTKISTIIDSNGESHSHMKWTQKGKKFIYDTLLELGFVKGDDE